MTDPEREEAFRLWHRWLECTLSTLMGQPAVDHGPDRLRMKMQELIEDWRFPPVTELTQSAKWLLYLRIVLTWAAVKHAEKQGWAAPMQPLMPWRLMLLLGTWCDTLPAAVFQLDASSHPVQLPPDEISPEGLEELRRCWTLLLADQPPGRLPPWLK